jgi:hypothetical protein
MLSGFKVGETVKVTFYYATAEQYLHTTTTPISGGWDVSLGGQSKDTSYLTIGNKGFSGWEEVTETFTATAASELLSFTAIGTGTAADPPFALLDGVSISVPEPATWAMMILGVMGVGCAARMRRQETIIAA